MRVTLRASRTEVTSYDAQIEASDAWTAVKNALMRKVGLSPDQWIMNGHVWEEVHTHTAWDHDVGKATPEQIDVYAHISFIDGLVRKL